MKKTFRRITAALTAAMMAAAVMVSVYAAETSSDATAQVILLETKDGKPVDDAALAEIELSKYEDFFKAIGATDEQVDAIYLAGQVKLDVGSVVELQMLQPAQKDNLEADLTLLVGKQAAVSITGPEDGKTIEDADHNKYLPLTVKGEKEGTDVYVANVEPYGICAYEFVVGSGEGTNNTDPALYEEEAVENTASDPQKDMEEVKTINYNPSPLGVSLSNAGSSWLSQGGVKENGKQIDGVTIAGHAQYSAAAPVVSTPKTIRVGALNPEDIITISNASGKAAKTEKAPERIGMLNEEEIITISNASGKAEKTEEAKPARMGMLNPEDIIQIL